MLRRLADTIDWPVFDKSFGALYSPGAGGQHVNVTDSAVWTSPGSVDT